MISEPLTVEKIINKVCLHTNHHETFLFFFDELYLFLTKFNTDFSKKLDVASFEDFIGFSITISKKLFESFSDNGRNVSLYKFCKNMVTLYFYNNDIDDKIYQVFNYFDYGKNGIILVDDIKTIFNHFNILYSGQKESLNPIMNKWSKYQKFNRREFWRFIKTENSDILTLFYLFFNHFRKISQELINIFDEMFKNNLSEKYENYTVYNWKLHSPSQELISFINENFSYLFENEITSNENEDLSELNNFESELSNLKNKIIDDSETFKFIPKKTNKNKYENIIQSYIQPHIELSSKKTTISNFNSEKKKMKFQTTFKIDSIFKDNKINENTYITYIFCNGIIKKYVIKIVKECLIFFNSDSIFNNNTFIEMIYINNAFIKKKSKKIIGSNFFYSIEININLGYSSYYSILLFTCKNSRNKFKEEIRKIIKNRKINHFYHLNKKNNHSTLKVCINKQDKKKYFVKILEKDYSKQKKILYYRTEKDKFNILKKLNHENILKCYDIFETKDYLYLIYEYTNNGNLICFIEENKNLDSIKIENILSQLIEGIKYIRSYGLIPNDLNPENIMIQKENNEIKVRIISFNLIKIINPHEGNFKSIQNVYNNSSDFVFKLKNNIKIGVWNLGIISHYLSNSLNFVLDSTETITVGNINNTPVKINNLNISTTQIIKEKKKINIINPFIN